jgi:hypothetical protein
MKTIDTLIGDIYSTLEGATPFSKFSNVEVNKHLEGVFKREPWVRPEKTLRFSEIGTPCKRALWYKYHKPELAEKHQGSTLLKFYYGHILEETALALAEAAGHKVEGRQKPALIELANGWKVKGSGDAIIDGVPVDVKSVTKSSETKFKEGLVDDPFGYRLQLSGYATAWGERKAAFFTIQKELGHLGIYPIDVDPAWTLDKMEEAASAVKGSLEALPRLDPVPEGKSGNTKLGTSCSYCAFKEACYPEAKKFLYAKGPVWLVEVKKTPKVEEEIL